MSKITVANKDKPMTNLFEMGRTTINIKTAALLRGKVYIEEISAAEIKFGTPRTVSGAIPLKQKKEKPAKPPKEDGPPLIDLANFDAMALLNQEFNKLATPKLYDLAIETYNTTFTKWQGEIDNTQAKIKELQTASAPLMSLDINNFNVRDIEEIRKTVQDINTMVTTVQSAADDAQRMIGGIESDINTARQLEQNARSSLNDDINLLKSYIDLGSGNAFGVLEPFIRDMLSDSAEQYLDYGLMALEALEKIKAKSEAKPKSEPKPKKEKKVVFKGRNVIYPVTSYPAFFLGKLASDFTLDTWNWHFDLRDVTSDPDLINKPVSLDLGVAEVTGLMRKVNFDGKADFRTKPDDKFDAQIEASGFPLKLDKELSKAGINGFTGVSAFNFGLTGHSSGGVSGKGGVDITQAQLLEPVGTIAIAAADAVNQAGNIRLGLEYIYHEDKNDEFKIDTNLAELINQAVRRIAQAYAQKAMQEIERALRAKIDEYIDGKFASKDQIDTLLKVAKGDMSALNDVKASLTSKKDEFEQKIKGVADQYMQQGTEAVQQVTDEAAQRAEAAKLEAERQAEEAKEAARLEAERAAEEAKQEAARQAEQAAKDALQGKTPSIQAPSLPGLPGRR
jgi:uncharacterized protein (TIGR03545 family)